MGRARSSWRGKGRLEGGGAQGEGMGEGVGAARVWGGKAAPPSLAGQLWAPKAHSATPLGLQVPPLGLLAKGPGPTLGKPTKRPTNLFLKFKFK